MDILDISDNVYAFMALLEGSASSDDGWLYQRCCYIPRKRYYI